MKRIIILSLFCLISIYSKGQLIKGTVFDKNASPMAFANVIELAEDSSFIAGTTTDTNGKFVIEKVKNGAFLKISSVGYDNYFITIKSTIGDKDLGNVVMNDSEKMLSEVVIKGIRPLFKQKDGAIVTQVKGTMLAKLNTIEELLPQLPGTIKGRTGKIEIFGKGSPIIYINNRQIRNESELERLVPSDIKDIKVITSPGEEYDASGRAVIKITTISKDDGGSLLSKSYIKQSDDFSIGQSVVLGYQHNDISITGNFGYSHDKIRAYQPSSTELTTEKKVYQYDKEQIGRTCTPELKYQLGVDYNINSHNSIGISFDGKSNTDKELRTGTLTYGINNKLTKFTIIDNHYNNKTNYQHLNAFYNVKYGKVTGDINTDYVHNGNNYTQNTSEYHKETDAIYSYSNGTGELNLFALKTDWKIALSTQTDLTCGVELGYTKNNSNLYITSARDISSDYKTEENRYAVFMGLVRRYKNLSISGGVRYEDCVYKYIDRIDNTSPFRKHYRHLFPSFKLSYNNDTWNHSLTFSSQITRPSFRQMSNASYYSNEYMYQQGNPQLVPSRTYSVKFNIGYKFFLLSMAYDFKKDHIATCFYNNGTDNIVISTFKNYNKLQTLKAYLNIHKKWGVWNPSLSLGVNQPFFKYDYRGQNINHNFASVYVVLNQILQLPNNFMLSNYIYYNTGGNQGAVKLKPYHSFDVRLQKSFLSERLVISFSAEDIFHGMKFKETELLDAFRFVQTEDYNLWNYSLNITYRINSKKTKYRGNNSLDSDIKRL